MLALRIVEPPRRLRDLACIRHADARLVTVCVTKVDAGLRVKVSDDGRGGATRSVGGGIQGVTDRLAALGAWLQLDSPVGGGTRILTVLPCG